MPSDSSCILRLAGRPDVPAVAELHRRFIDRGFLSLLGTGFLRLMYSSLVQWQGGRLFVAVRDARVVGFVSGAESLRAFFRHFAIARFAQIVLTLVFRIFAPGVLKGIFEILRYPAKAEVAVLPDAELLSIVVDLSERGKDTAAGLFRIFASRLKSGGVLEFKIIVGSVLTPAIRFYEKQGCVRRSRIEVHQGSDSFVYICRTGDAGGH